jgi:hypothetical protein
MDEDILQISTTKKGKDFWGPPQWGTIHILCYFSKKENEKYLVEYLWVLTQLLPCDFCRQNLKKKLLKYPPEAYVDHKNTGSAFLYSYILHDLANEDITAKNPDKPPKISPVYEEIEKRYENIINYGLWYRYIWASIHILAITLRSENIKYYKRMLELLVLLLPQREGNSLKEFMEKYPIDPYLRNNQDTFFYSYVVHDLINRKLGKISPPYQTVKIHYFSALNEECNNCRV